MLSENSNTEIAEGEENVTWNRQPMVDLHLQSTSGESDNGRDEGNKNQQPKQTINYGELHGDSG